MFTHNEGVRVKQLLFLSLLLLGTCQGKQEENKIFNITFHQAMSNHRHYNAKFAQKDPNWQLARELYKQFVLDALVYVPQPRIPKIIHQIWLGSPLPERYKQFQESWKRHHPDWQYILWTDKDIEEFGLTNKDLYNQSTNWGQKADIARYEILYRIGGLYVDTDFECFKKFDVFHHCFDFYTGIYSPFSRGFRVSIGIIGSVPGHPILKTCIQSMRLDVYPSSNPMNIIHTTGPEHFTRCFLKEVKNSGRCVAFPVNFFYPWPCNNRDETRREKILSWLKHESFAIHYWDNSWNYNARKTHLTRFVNNIDARSGIITPYDTNSINNYLLTNPASVLRTDNNLMIANYLG